MTTGPGREYFYQKEAEEKEVEDSAGAKHEVRHVVELQEILAEFKGDKKVRELLHKFEDVVFDDAGNLTNFLNNPKNKETAVQILSAILDALENFENEVSAGTITGDMPQGVVTGVTEQELIVNAIDTIRGLVNTYVAQFDKKLNKEQLARLQGSTEDLQREKALEDIKTQLKKLEKIRLEIVSDQVDTVSDHYKPIEEEIKRLATAHNNDKDFLKELKKIELEMLKKQYNHRRESYTHALKLVETRNYGVNTEWPQFARQVVEATILVNLRRHVEEISKLGNPKVTKDYQNDFKNIERDWDKRRRGHYVRVFNEQNVVFGKDLKRLPLADVKDELVYNGGDLQSTVREGLMDPDFKGLYSNLVMREREVEMRSFTKANKVEKNKFNETAVGWCMRLFDQVYMGLEPDARMKNGQKITTQNLYDAVGDLIEYTYEKLIKKVAADHIQGMDEAEARKRIDPTLVERAFYVHAIATLNHSYLATGSSLIEDNFYYLFHWLEYAIKYFKAGTGGFNPLITLSLFGFGGNFYEDYLGRDAVLNIRNKLKAKDLYENNPDLAEELGLTGLDILCDGSFITLTNVAQGKEKVKDPKTGRKANRERVNTPVFSPPLRYFVVHGKDAKGKDIPLRYPPLRYKDADEISRKHEGRYITLDDYQTTDGDRIYEMMPLEQIGGRMVNYHTQLHKNGYLALYRIFKSGESELISELGTHDKMNSLKNQLKYSMSIFPTVGNAISEGEKFRVAPKGTFDDPKDEEPEIGKAVMNGSIIVLAYAFCLVQTDPARHEGRWSMNQVRDYLSSLARRSVFGEGEVGYKVAEGIEIAVEEGMKWPLRKVDFMEALAEQIKEQAKVR